MSGVQITVRGSHDVELPAERGTVHLSTYHSGKDPEEVRERVTGAAARILERIAEHYDEQAGPVTFRSADQLRTWSHRPYHDKGKELPFEYGASISLRIEFSDFAELSRLVNWATDAESVEVGRTSWSLTEETRATALREVQSRAVREARDRAQTYADALDLGAVTPAAIADVGLLGASGPPVPMSIDGGGPNLAPAGMRSAGGAAHVDLTPQKITVAATVEASFTVS